MIIDQELLARYIFNIYIFIKFLIIDEMDPSFVLLFSKKNFYQPIFISSQIWKMKKIRFI